MRNSRPIPWFSFVLGCALALGCGRSGHSSSASAASSASSNAPGAASAGLGTRAEATLRADELALSGSRKLGRDGDTLLERAAGIREQLYRRERRQVDALEAIEILRELSRRPGRECSATLRRVVLEAELTRDPTTAYRAIQALSVDGSDCRSAKAGALGLLAAYKTSDAAPLASSAAVRPAAIDGIVLPPELSARAGPARITRVEPYGAKDSARVVIHSTNPALFSVGQLNDGGERTRLYVDVKGATLATGASYDVGGLVERVRLGQNPDSVRIVLELSARAERRVFYVPEPFRLVIDVSASGSEPQPSVVGRRSVRRVVLDPGHGGNDPGAIGPSGLREKDVTLDIAHRAAPLLARQLGVTTLLTRDGDHYVPLEERIARANSFQADLFVSIHCNSSDDGAGRAVMTFVLDETREDAAMKLAARENAASPAAAAELANAMSGFSDPESAAASLHFAGLLQRAAMGSLAKGYAHVPDGGVKRAGFYVLAGARMPAVLFETSFISSLDGETRFNTADFRQRLADAIVNAVRAYREGL